jgi:uncharacterized protein
MEFITEPWSLKAVYGSEPPPADGPGPGPRTLGLEHRRLLDQATLVVLATLSNDGIACSPRGGPAGTLAHLADDHTLWVPDAAVGRIHETVRNLLLDPRLGLLYIAPSHDEVLRIQGIARISADPEALQPFEDLEPAVRSVMVVDVQAVRISGRGPMRRAHLWPDPLTVPL